MADLGKVRVKMVRVPFNYHWPRAAKVSVIRELGPALLDAHIAEAAIAEGAAVPFNPAPAKPSRSRASTAAPKADIPAEDAPQTEDDDE